MNEVCLIFVTVGDRILLLRRCKDESDHNSEMFGLVGGGKEEGEGYYDCAKRESMEEIGLVPYDVKFFKKYKTNYATLIIFTAKLDDCMGIKLNDEHTEHKLFTYDDLFNDSEVIETNKKFLKDIMESR